MPDLIRHPVPSWIPALTLTKAIQDKKISSVELLEYFIERYERLNPEINAIVATNFDQARKKAIAADEILARGETLGPLYGLPMTLKDNLQIIGMPTTCGSDQLAEYIPESNADVAQSVLDAGAIVFGKTNLPLFGKDTQTFNDLYGQTNNPWNFLSLVSYLPSTAAPAGFTPGGLPVGIQIVGPYLEDLTPIQFAINLEKEIIGPYQLPKGFEG